MLARRDCELEKSNYFWSIQVIRFFTMLCLLVTRVMDNEESHQKIYSDRACLLKLCFNFPGQFTLSWSRTIVWLPDDGDNGDSISEVLCSHSPVWLYRDATYKIRKRRRKAEYCR